MRQFQQRKATRLRGIDYGECGSYFLTICTQDRQQLLGNVVGGGVLDAPHVQLSEFGKIAERVICAMDETYEDLSVDRFAIMPDHLHLLITIRNFSGTSGTPSPTNRRIPFLVSTLKRLTNREIGRPIWQRSYYDHVVRNQADYDEIMQYIQNNPAAWAERKNLIP